jgi:hypothetical protein
LSNYKCKSCNTINQTHVVDANKYASQIDSLILKSQKEVLAKKLADNGDDDTNELNNLNTMIGELEALICVAQKCFEQFFECDKEREKAVALSLCSTTENIYLIKSYECLLELCIRVKCYSKAICIAESLLIIYKFVCLV